MPHPPPLEKKKVYDALLRLLHATMALSVVGLGATGWGSELFEDGPNEAAVWKVHFLLGDVLAVTLALRVAWGIVGPLHARWTDMWHPKEWLGALRARWPTPGRFGHDVMASGAYLALYGVLALLVVTGLGMEGVEHGTGPLGAWLFDRENLGELMEEPHEFGAALVAGFVVLHLTAMAWHQQRERRPVLQAMWTGYQFQPTKEP